MPSYLDKLQNKGGKVLEETYDRLFFSLALYRTSNVLTVVSWWSVLLQVSHLLQSSQHQ